MTEELKISGVRKLAEVLGISKTTAAEHAKASWFPKKGPDGSWITSEVQKAFAAFKSGSLGSQAFSVRFPNLEAFEKEAAARTSTSPAPSGEAMGADEAALQNVLRTSNDPEQIAQATMALVARSIAEAGNRLEVKHVIAMKSALEELRKGAGGYLKLAQEKGDLIRRDVAKAVIGQLAQRAIRVLERYEVQLAQRVEAWFGDPAFKALSSEERARVVRAWAVDQTQSVRSVEAAEVEKLVAAEVEEQAKTA